ncbi:hypothetical protein T02_12108 [Trichinella nativa]|uniref:Secreted protein n=1 Tax=Trichinella nativa TaxID=6335 RepID=A0A0V1KRY4_9BILA|nr:hypothetical protein T02_12108 [Trichinella nativa]
MKIFIIPKFYCLLYFFIIRLSCRAGSKDSSSRDCPLEPVLIISPSQSTPEPTCTRRLPSASVRRGWLSLTP